MKKIVIFAFFPLLLSACGNSFSTQPIPKECKEALEAYKVLLETMYPDVQDRSEIKEYIKDLERSLRQEIVRGEHDDAVPDCIEMKDELEELIQKYRQEMTVK